MVVDGAHELGIGHPLGRVPHLAIVRIKVRATRAVRVHVVMALVIADLVFVSSDIRVPSEAVFRFDGRAVRQFYSPRLRFPPFL
jgi:hypothetical protein